MVATPATRATPVGVDMPLLRVGVTGHRPNRLVVGEPILAASVHDTLMALAGDDRFGRRRLEVASALAEGADRIIAREGLALGARLVALLPFPVTDYETTFSEAAPHTAFQSLLGLASERVELSGTLAEADAGYEAIGREMVQRSDIVMTIWDGKPAAGRGGTPEILQAALDAGKPILWIHAGEERAIHLLQPAGGKPAPRLDSFARTSTAVSRMGLMTLAASLTSAKRANA